ncbi:MAG: copper amine oxidase [Firmicutes bacterium HGW-Firmicutes-7]|nr:MAG: copper amine oxidase [Firmicutes bacterium HGW-Firmicutes-7]
MKKAMIILIFVVMITSTYSFSYGATNKLPITMYLNGSFVATDVLPYKANGTTYVPIKPLTDALGITEVIFQLEDYSVTIVDSNKTIKFFIDQNIVWVNEREYYINATPTIIDDRTMVPLEFMADNFDCEITWDNLTETVYITKDGLEFAKNTSIDSYYPEDVLWLARIVHVEAHSISYEGKLAVANVVLNRKKSDVFPDTIHDVIFHPGQFPPAHKSGFTSLVPSQECLLAAKNALNGENNISTSLYFNNRPFQSKSSDLYKIIDGEYFYY